MKQKTAPVFLAVTKLSDADLAEYFKHDPKAIARFWRKMRKFNEMMLSGEWLKMSRKYPKTKTDSND